MRKIQFSTGFGVLVLVLSFALAVAQSDDTDKQVDLKPGNPGCVPSSCRGGQTKFGEAKVITDLRSQLIIVKSRMKLSPAVEFSPRSYDQENIVGETDDESLAIIMEEVERIENEFYSKLGTSFQKFDPPNSKAKQARYIKKRLDYLLTVI